MKTSLENLLCRLPILYAYLEKKRSRPDIEKIVYLTLIQSGQTLVEAGANLGHYTRLFCRISGAKGCVLAFEPVASTYGKLAHTCANANLPLNPTLFMHALSSRNQDTQIYTPGEDHGKSSLKQHGEEWVLNAKISSESIKAITLDDILKKYHTKPAFIKLDVEGAELHVIQGAKATIKNSKPIIHLEISDQWLKAFKHTPEMLCNYLVEHGHYDTWWAYGPDIGMPRQIGSIDELIIPLMQKVTSCGVFCEGVLEA